MQIINNKQTEYMIVSNQYASECVRFSANELQKYLYLSTDCLIPLHSDKCEKRKKELVIGFSRDYTDCEELKGLSDEGFVIKEINGDICFFGNSDRAIIYSVYYFLEHFINYRCFTSTLEKYDKVDTIEFNKTIVFDFDFEYREIYFTDAFKTNFAYKNMLNSNLADLSNRVGGKTKWYNFHHSFSDICNTKDYFETHPEYFSYLNGKRQKEHTELCLSNEEVVDIAVKRVLEWKKEKPECKVFSVSQDEWMGHFIKMACECDNCKKIDDYEESQSGSIINFVNKVATEVNKVYPEVLIHTFAYQYSRKPPKHVKPVDNVIVRLCNIECSWSKPIEKATNDESIKFYSDLLNWSKITNKLYIWDYAVNFHNYLLPFPNICTMVENIKLYKRIGVKGLLMQGNFSNGGQGYLDELKSYIASRYMRYNDLDLNEEIMDFCNAYYGPYANIVYEYLMLWEKEVVNYDLWLYDDSNHPMFNDKTIKKAFEILSKAKDVNASEEYKNHFDLVYMSYEYLYLTRLPLDTNNRNEMIDKFFEKVTNHHITELFERTELEFSKKVMKESQYANNREGWISLYYIMR